jgi:DNA-binding CsgD family transcriptional regulator
LRFDGDEWGIKTRGPLPALAPRRGRRQECGSDDVSERRIRWLLGSLGLGSFALLVTLEVATEGDELSWFDLAVDAVSLLLTIGAAVGVALLAQRIQAQHEERTALLRDLAVARAEGDGWRAKVRTHLAGLKAGLDRQFEEWRMTAAEREVGLLILKGLSHKEIASLRATTEATVRQQAQAIYRKAKLPGKTAFSAYFLEDLWAPEVAAEGNSTAPGAAPPGDQAAPRVGRGPREPLATSL